MPFALGDRLGTYDVVSPLGSGGMGEVWKARDTRPDSEIAIKISTEELASGSNARRAVAALNHPNVCPLYDVGPNYLVMDLVEGAPLAPLDTSRKLLDLTLQIADPAERNAWLREACQGDTEFGSGQLLSSVKWTVG